MKNEDTSKLLISDELKNFSDIFSNFAGLINSNLKTNERLSKTLKEQLVNNLIDAKEVVILENKTGIESVNVIASNEQVLKKEMPQIISKITKNFMRLKVVEHTEISGLSLASFVPISKLRVEFFVSTKAKEKRNGDNVIVSKLSENRYFVAIADGMGHGESANRISSMVLSLIRSMFEVGLDINLIIQSVNKLLLPAGLDNFTTLDACVVDLDSCVASFIKLGSSVSAIKHKLKTEIVACESLPIGIVQNITPTISSKSVQSGDVIFLASDGIVDSFSNIENFRCFVNDAKIFNMQKFLDDVVVDAGETSKHADDMTIIAINLLKNY
jgi:stage II sporulation protein E